jgi:HEAT repeat protein
VLLALSLAATILAGCGGGDLASPDPGRRARAVRALGGGERTLAALLVAQRDPSPLVRAAAAEAFAARGGPASADALGKLLVDTSAEVAVAAARALGAMPEEPRARAHLAAAYADATPAGRAAIADALEQMGVSLREAVESEARIRWERNLAGLVGSRGAARGGAAEELGASGRSEAVQRLLPFVDPSRNPDRALAAAAARGLGAAGDWAARPHLETLLQEPDAALAEAAAGALARLGDPAAADALAEAGGTLGGRIGLAVVDALTALPEAPEVGLALCDVANRATDPMVASRAAREARRRDAACPWKPLVARVGSPGSAAALAALAEMAAPRDVAAAAAERIVASLERSPDVEVRIAAARALARIGGTAAATAVGRRAVALVGRIAERRARTAGAPGASGAGEAADPVPAVEAREARALLGAAGALRAAGMEPLFLAHARDAQPELRAGALEGLSLLGGAGAPEILAAALADPDPGVAGVAAEGLGRFGSRGAPALVAAARGERPAAPEWRAALARALGATGATEAIPALAALLDGPSAAAAAAGLARVGAPAAAAPLAAHIGRPEAQARADAIEALAQLVARDAAPAIAALLTDDRADVRATAARALGRLRYEPASVRLEALRSDYDGRVRRAAVEALAKLPSGGPRARR